jgi:hypothetical protein
VKADNRSYRQQLAYLEHVVDEQQAKIHELAARRAHYENREPVVAPARQPRIYRCHGVPSRRRHGFRRSGGICRCERKRSRELIAEGRVEQHVDERVAAQS